MKTLNEKRQDMTRGLILQAAFELLRDAEVNDLTVRAVAQHAVMSERTVFRYFPSKDALLDAVAAHLLEHMAVPDVSDSREGLLEAPRVLYQAFEEHAEYTRAALHPDLFEKVRSLQANTRWTAISRVLDAMAPASGQRERRIAAANICFHLTASSWHYYRTAFGFTLEECIACAETAVQQALQGLGVSERTLAKSA